MSETLVEIQDQLAAELIKQLTDEDSEKQWDLGMLNGTLGLVSKDRREVFLYIEEDVNQWIVMIYVRGKLIAAEKNDDLFKAIRAHTQRLEPISLQNALDVVRLQRSAVEPIRVWKFHDAPGDLKELSEHYGDEDWIAVVPNDAGDYIPWAQDGGAFGCSSVQETRLPDGSLVLIGAHA